MQTYDRPGVTAALKKLAEALHCDPLTQSRSESLFNFVLGDGKKGMSSCSKGLITERELRNLLMAHAVTAISEFNKQPEPDCINHQSQALCTAFEEALFGRPCILVKGDQQDPWE